MKNSIPLLILVYWTNFKTITGQGTCGFNATASDEEQILTSPGWPDQYPPNLDCRWNLKALDGFRVKLIVESFETESSFDTLKIFNGPDTIYRTGNITIQETVYSLNGLLRMVFTSDGSVQKRGFKAIFTRSCGFNVTASDEEQLLTSPGWPNPYPSDLDCVWVLKAPNGFQVKLTIHSIETDYEHDILKIFEATDSPVELSGNETTQTTFLSLNGILTMKFTSDGSEQKRGFKAVFTRTCGFNATASDEEQILTSPGWPDQYPPNLDCRWNLKALDGFRVKLIVESFETESSFDTLKIFEATDSPVELSGNETTQTTFLSLNGILTTKFTSDGSEQKRGFKAVFTRTCKFNLTASDEEQLLTSPGWPNPYPSDLDCVWVLKAPNGFQVKLTIHSIETEYEHDTLKIFEATDSPVELSGNETTQTTFLSLNGILAMKFTSDGSVQKRGFKAIFTRTCGFNATASHEEQILTTPGWPDQYPPNLDCRWNLKALDGFRVKLIVESFETESGFDTLKIFNGPEFIYRTGNKTLQETFYSLNGLLRMVFTSDGSAQGRGFKAIFKRSCGFNVTAIDEAKLLTSPGWPNPYPSDLDCVWVLKAPNGFQVKLTIHSIETEYEHDTLKIFEATDSPVELSGNETTQTTFLSLNGILAMKFTSDGSEQKRGFKAFFTRICDFNLTASDEAQLITSPGWPNKYLTNADCMWILKAPNGFQVNLTVELFGLELVHDTLQIFEATDSPVELSGKEINQTSFLSLNGFLKITFISDLYYTEQKHGFKAFFTTPCGFNATASNELQVLTSPGWPEPYESESFCLWILTAQKGFEVKLVIEFLDIADSGDSFTVDDGHSFLRLQSFSSSRVYFSYDMILKIRFYSPSNPEERRGFNASFTKVNLYCVSNISVTNENQVLATPTWPHPSRNNLNCRWILKASEGFQVKLTVHQSITSNDQEVFKMFDGCRTIPLDFGFMKNTVIFSTNGTLIVEYRSGVITYNSDGSLVPLQKTGFNATFVGVPCHYEATVGLDVCDKTVHCDPSADIDVVTSTSICTFKNHSELRQPVFGTFSVVTCSANQTILCSNPISYLNTTYCDLDCTEFFRCENNECARRSSVCDGNSCNGCQEDDGWENGKGFRCIRNGQFCKIPQSMLWDRIPDCDHGDDLCFSTEVGYSKTRDVRFLPSTTFKESICFRCLDQSIIIPQFAVCDGIINCPDLSDECLCEGKRPTICDDVVLRSIPNMSTDTSSCAIGQVSCGNGSCLNRASVCDSIADCPDNRDEKNEYCGVTLQCKDVKAINIGQECRCQILCSNKIGVACDGLGECLSLTFESSDEYGRKSSGQFDDECFAGCRINRCIWIEHDYLQLNEDNCQVANSVEDPYGRLPKEKICDGVVDCTDDHDEVFCDERFRCPAKGLISIPIKKVCDGVHDCDDESDERRANCTQRFYCSVHQNTKISIERRSICDSNINCDDSSDEIGCLNDGRFYCENKTPLFVSKQQTFDGYQDCSDGSDECPRSENEFSSRYQLIANPIFRTLVWIMGLMAFAGNAVVICGETRAMSKLFPRSSSAPLRTSHMLIFNLAISDLLMGIYLIMLGIAGVIYSGVFCLHKLDWLSSTTCTSMGVLVVLSSEGSVITMVLLTSCRLYAVVKPFEASRRPKVSTVYIMIGIGWFLAFALALVPLTENFQYIFANRALISQSSFFEKSVVSFESAKSWAMRSVTYAPSYISNPDEVMMQIQNAVSWKGFQEAVHHLNLSSSFTSYKYLGYYSASSVCIPRLFQTPHDHSFAFSFAITTFNFFAFIYILTAYAFIVIHTKRESMNRLAQGSMSQIDRRNAALQNKIVRLLITDFCCWVPLSVMAFMYASEIPIPDVIYVISAIVLLPINSALNPILYSDFVSKIVSKLRKSLRQRAPSSGKKQEIVTPQGGLMLKAFNKAKIITKTQPNTATENCVLEGQNTPSEENTITREVVLMSQSEQLHHSQ